MMAKKQQPSDIGRALIGKPLMVNAAVQRRYTAALEVVIDRMLKQTRRAFEKLFAEPHAVAYAEDASTASQARILASALRQKFEAMFADIAKPAAERMVRDTEKASAATMGSSLKEISDKLTLKTDVLTGALRESMKASVNENVALIKSIPSQYLDQVEGAVMRSITTGNGLQDLMPALQNYEGVTKRRARLIAQDQTRKTYSAINKHRMSALGIRKFKWLHSAGGQHPRRDHIAMSGQIYSVDNPPVIDKNTGERGMPGQAINCRCVAIPVVDFGEDEE
jgi:SPP1 gp7 family putative phage head morphogenesis protein